MNMRTLNQVVTGGLLTMGLLVGGCATGSKSTPVASSAMNDTVIVHNPQGKVGVFNLGQGATVRATMEPGFNSCEGCKTAIVAHFNNGSPIVPACTHCGATRTVLPRVAYGGLRNR